MRVLFLSHVLPHAQVVSGAINVHQRIRLLAERGYEVGLACFAGPEEEQFVHAVRPMLYELEMLPRPQGRGGFIEPLSRLVCPIPADFCNVRDPAMGKLVGRMVSRSHYDAVIAEFSVMGQYLYRNPYLSAVRRVISCHSCLASALRKAIRLRPYSVSAMLGRMRLKGLQRYEFGMYRSADLILTLTAEERLDLLRYDPELRISVVPYGVDVETFHPHPSRTPEECLVYTGYFAQEPNSDAFHWFVKTTWPQLKAAHPGLKFYVVGSGATRDMQEIARRDPQIVVTGAVDDVAAYLARARIYVCPMRMGTGFRGKILQAMAAGVPVVSTALAAEGIPAQNGHNILLADTPHTMVEGVNLLLRDAGLRRSMAANARDLMVRRFAWSHCVDLLDQILREVTRKNQPSGS